MASNKYPGPENDPVTLLYFWESDQPMPFEVFLLVSACSYQPFSANQRCNLVINCDFNSSERTQVVVCIVCY